MSQKQYRQCLDNPIFTRADQKIIDQYLSDEKINRQVECEYIIQLKIFTDATKYAIIVYFSSWFDDKFDWRMRQFILAFKIMSQTHKFFEYDNQSDVYVCRSMLKYKVQSNKIVNNMKVLDYLYSKYDKLIQRCIYEDTYEHISECNIDELLQIAMHSDINVACKFDIKLPDDKLNALINIGYETHLSWDTIGTYMNEHMMHAFMRHNPISLLNFSKYLDDDMLHELASMDIDKNKDECYYYAMCNTRSVDDNRFEQFEYHTLPVIVYNLQYRRYSGLTAYDTERVNSYRMQYCNDVRLLTDILITYPYSFAMIMNKKTKKVSARNIRSIYDEYEGSILPQLEYASRFSNHVYEVYITLPYTYCIYNTVAIDTTYFAIDTELQYDPLACLSAINRDPRNIIYAKCSDLSIYDNFLASHPEMLELIPKLSDNMMLSLIEADSSNAHKKPIHGDLMRLLNKNRHLAGRCNLTKEEMAKFIYDNESYCHKTYLQKYNNYTAQFYDAIPSVGYQNSFNRAYKYDINRIKSIREWYLILSGGNILYTCKLKKWMRINVEYLFFDGVPMSINDYEN